MIRIRRSDERGDARHGWLHSRHTFSFAGYWDPAHMGFRNLRVLNEDRVAPGAGFPTHPHRDMEILSIVLDGALEHRDSMGTGSVVRPGDVQRMTAGTGVLHSEFNASADAPLHFLQIWIVPESRGLAPGYEQRSFPEEERRDRLRLLAAPDGADGALTLHADARLWGAALTEGARVEHPLPEGRHAWVQVTRGRVRLGDQILEAGDGAAVSDAGAVALEGVEPAEALLFELP